MGIIMGIIKNKEGGAGYYIVTINPYKYII